MSTTFEPVSQTAKQALEVTYVALSALHPDPRNARTHSKRLVAQIAQSIRTFGFTNPILADEYSGGSRAFEPVLNRLLFGCPM